MPGRKYRDYVGIDTEFVPVFSRDSDELYPEKWKSFFPHGSFKTLVRNLLESLEKNKPSTDMSVWMHGAWGTGKTFASFAIKHLLEEDDESVRRYCVQHDMADVAERIQGIKSRGKVLVAHRSSASSISSDNHLYNAITTAVRDALKRKGLSYFGGATQFDLILDRLKDKDGTFSFDRAFSKHRDRFQVYECPGSVIRDLESLGPEKSLDLLETIVNVAESENYVFTLSAADLVSWLDDVRARNGLHAIVFIWDEFTEFFRNNPNRIGGLQEIAHASARVNFYFLLITHSGTQLIYDESARKIIEARFKISSIQMAESTGIALMSQSIRIDPVLVDEWDHVSRGLWTSLGAEIQKDLLPFLNAPKGSDLQREFQRLLPMHPYASFLLKIISTEVSSNQRTMFQFISGHSGSGGAERHNFAWFLDKHSPESDWKFLTTDYLWDYFMTEDNADLVDSFRRAMSQYAVYSPAYEAADDYLRVLKVALLLYAIQERSGYVSTQGQSRLLRATEKNIAMAFSGTALQRKVPAIMADFVNRKIMSLMEDRGEKLYVPPVTNMDSDRLAKIKQELQRTSSFEAILRDNGEKLFGEFSFTNFLKRRFPVFYATPGNYKDVMQKAIGNRNGNQIPVFFVLAKNESDQVQCANVATTLREKCREGSVIADFSSSPLTNQEYEKIITARAEERYHGEGTSQGRLAKRRHEEALNEWKTKLGISTINISVAGEGPMSVQGAKGLQGWLRTHNGRIFSSGLEQIASHDKLFDTRGYKEQVALMGMGRAQIISNYNYLNSLKAALEQDGLWGRPDYASSMPQHLVSQMKQKLMGHIQKSFETDNRVDMYSIWDFLKSPPFGFLESAGSLFLTGFLMQEFGDGKYYFYDGTNDTSLNHSLLANKLFLTMNGLQQGSARAIIVRQKHEHTEVCKIVGEAFSLSKAEQGSVQGLIKSIKRRLSEYKYPLWAAAYGEHHFSDDDLKEATLETVSLLCDLIAPQTAANKDEIVIVENMYTLFKRSPGVAQHLARLVEVERLKAGMLAYVVQESTVLSTLAVELGIEHNSMLDDVYRRLPQDSSYLWDKEDFDGQVEAVCVEYSFIHAVNTLLRERHRSLEHLSRAAGKQLERVKLPRPLILHEYPRMQPALDALVRLSEGISGLEFSRLTTDVVSGSEDFRECLSKQEEMFSRVMSRHGLTMSQSEARYVFGKLPSNTIDQTVDRFVEDVANMISEQRLSSKVTELKELWAGHTGKRTVREWCNEYLIDISVVLNDDMTLSQRTIGLINGDISAESEDRVQESIDYLRRIMLPILSDVEHCSVLFAEILAGDYAPIIADDIEALQLFLADEMGMNAWKWANNRAQLTELVARYAKERYQEHYLERVTERVRALSPSQAQAALTRLASEDPLIGIGVMKL